MSVKNYNMKNVIRNKAMPFRMAFGKKEYSELKKVINYYLKKKIDPPYSGIFEKKFCKQFSNFMGGGYTTAVTSGTAALYVALQSLELKRNDEVLISNVTDCGPFNCLVNLGLTPKIVDTAYNSYNPCPGTVVSRLSKKTKCVIISHIAGEPTFLIDKIYKYLKKNKIYLIEDCSQSPGAKWNNKRVGVFSDISVFSTMYRKTLHTGGNGGLIFTKNKKLHINTLAYSDKGKQVWNNKIDLRNPNYAKFPGLNFTNNELSAAIGIGSLKRLNATIYKRNLWVKKLIERMKILRICYPYRFDQNFSTFFFPIFVRKEKNKFTKKKFASSLINEGIGLQGHYGCLISDWKWAKKYLADNFNPKNSRDVRDNSFNLFVNENYGLQEISDVIKSLIKVEKKFIKKKFSDIEKKTSLSKSCCGFKNNKCNLIQN